MMVAHASRAWKGFAKRWGEDGLLWSVLPALDLKLTEARHFPLRKYVGGLASNTVRAVTSRSGPELRLVGQTVFLSTGIQTGRTLWPVADALETSVAPRTRISFPALGPAELPGHLRRASSLFRAARDMLRRDDTDLHDDAFEEIFQTCILLTRAERLFEAHQIRTLVVATQHNSATRAVLLSAERAGVTTCYLPHAPLPDNAAYADLPAHYALLRGPKEADHYATIGAAPSQMIAVGDPSADAPPAGAVPRDGATIWAPSPHGDEVLRRTVAVLRDAKVPALEVTPHPRMRRQEMEQLCPGSWRIHDPGPTARRLRNGCRALIQTNSGVGLDALLLGIPVVNLSFDGRTPAYLYMRDPEVRTVSTADELSRWFLDLDASEAAASRRRTKGEGWCIRMGEAAADAAAQSLYETVKLPRPARLVLDGWHASAL